MMGGGNEMNFLDSYANTAVPFDPKKANQLNFAPVSELDSERF